MVACSNRCFEDQDQLLGTFFKLRIPLPILLLLIVWWFKKMPKKIEINCLLSKERSFSDFWFLFRNDLSLYCGFRVLDNHYEMCLDLLFAKMQKNRNIKFVKIPWDFTEWCIKIHYMKYIKRSDAKELQLFLLSSIAKIGQYISFNKYCNVPLWHIIASVCFLLFALMPLWVTS